MTNRELECLGMALDVLLANNLIEEARKITKKMANENPEKRETEKDSE